MVRVVNPGQVAEHDIGCKVASPKKLFAWKTSGDFGYLIFPPLPQNFVSTFYLLLSIVAELPSVHHNKSPQDRITSSAPDKL